jgi:hypothetical protein
MMIVPGEDRAPVAFDEFHVTAAAAIYVVQGLQNDILSKYFK